MKPHLPVRLFKALMTAAAVCTVTGIQTARAGIMHTDATYQTYTDFGQNCGRYVTGVQVNALLQHIREDVDGGIKIHYTDGTEPYVISNEQGMIDFRGTDDIGAQVAVSPTFAATVLHNGPISASYGNRTVGTEHAINYQSIDIRHSNVFRLHPTTSDHDFMMQRQSKLQTDAVWNPITTERDMKSLEGTHVYHSGSGSMGVYDNGQINGLAGAYTFIIGAINEITYAENYDGHTHIRVQQNPEYHNGIGASLDNPLPNAIRGGDSGSPVFIYNQENQRYEYIAAQQSGGGTFGQALGDMEWMESTLDSFEKKVDMSSTSTVYLNAIDQFVETKTDNDGNSGSIYHGSVTDEANNVLVSYRGIQDGHNTWADLTDIKDNAAWYAWEGHLEQSTTNLFFNDNLVFSSGAETQNNIILRDDVDLGIGYVEFNEGKYTISSAVGEAGETYQLDSAGYVLNKGAEVHLQLVNTDQVTNAETGETHTRMTEWRAMGEGTLYIEGTGDTNALLNLGGKSTTYLQQTGGHAAYNVLVNTGATVVIKDLTQIERDFTFGSGGGTLDLNGNDFTWDNNQTVVAEGFTIHALTEEAFITNTANQKVTLTVNAPQEVYKGSFTGNMDVVYAGSGEWVLNSIHTALDEGSSLTVQRGQVTLAGTNTVHGMGSLSATNDLRRVNERDWHYADATMEVNVENGSTFELGSHARLTGDVTVESGGTFIMREGVQHDQEYVEGGQILEDTAQYAAFYGLKGDVQVDSGAEMQIHYNSGVTATQTYEGAIAGTGKLSVALGTDGAKLILTADNSGFTGEKTLTSGTLLGQDVNALGTCTDHKWQVKEAGVLGIMDSTIYQSALESTIDGSSTGVLALTKDQTELLNLGAHQGLIIGALEGLTVQYGTADSTLAAYDHDNDSSTAAVWQLGGGGGTLVVDARMTGGYDLILGNEYGKGIVKLTNTSNEIGNIIFTGQVTLDYDNAAVLGQATLDLVYTNRVYAHDSTNNVGTNSAGVLLVDKIATQDFDLTGHKSLYLGSEGDSVLSGAITVAEGETYKFGGTTGKLTVQSNLSAGHGLTIDGQTFSGGIVHLAKATGIDGAVLITGYDSERTTLTGGDITLSLGANNALAAAESVTATQGGVLDITGTTQFLKSLNVTATGTVLDSRGGGTLVLNRGTAEGILELSNLTKTGAGTLSITGSTNLNNLTLKGGTMNVGGAAVMSDVHIHGGSLVFLNNSYRIEALEIHEGGTFDVQHNVNGITADSIGERIPQIILSGGTLTNTGQSIDDNNRQLYMVALTKDSAINSASRFGIVGSGHEETGIDLAGHTLTKTGSAIFDLVNTTVSSGNIRVTEGALWFRDKDKAHDSTVEASVYAEGGTVGIVKSGTGSLTFSGEHTEISELQASNGTTNFTGTTTEVGSMNVSGGTVNFSGEHTAITKDDAMNVRNGTVNFTGNTVTFTDRLQVLKNGTVTIGSEDSSPEVTARRLVVYNSNDAGTANLIINSGTVNLIDTQKNDNTDTQAPISDTGSGILLGHWPDGKGILTVNGGTVNAQNTWTTISWDGSGELNLNGGTLNTYGVALSGASGNTRGHDSALNINGGRLNIGAGGITNHNGGTNKTISITGGTLGTLSSDWSTSVNMTLTGNLTVDTQVVGSGTEGNITFNGSLTGTEELKGSLTKTGAGTLTVNGAADLQHVTVAAGTLSITGTQSISGDLSISRGATLVLNGAYTLGAGQTLSVTDSATGGAATLDGSLTINGGNMIFSGAAMSTDTTALTVNSLSLGSDISGIIGLAFTEESALTTGKTYYLLGGDWSSLTSGHFTIAELEYLRGSVTTSSDGLYVSFSTKDGYVVWNGTVTENGWTQSAFAQQGALGSADQAIFNDSATEKTVTVGNEGVTANSMFFDNSEQYTITGTGSVTAGSLEKQGDGEALFANALTVTGDSTISEGSVSIAGTAEFNGVEIQENGNLNVTGTATAKSLNLQNGATVSGNAAGSLVTESLDFGTEFTLDGAQVTVTTGRGFENARLQGVTDEVTINLTNGATLDDRESFYKIQGTVNLTSSPDTSTVNYLQSTPEVESTIYINGLRMTDIEHGASELNIGNGIHLVITGNRAMSSNSASGQGSFSLTHWNAHSEVNILGKLTSNAVISGWDGAAAINVGNGGELNLLAGLARNGHRGNAINVNIGDGATLNAAGGTHAGSLHVNLEAGATLGGIADTAGGTAVFTNDLNLGTDGSSGTLVFDTDVKTVNAETFMLSDNTGMGGDIVLSGATNIKGTPTLQVTGSGKLWLAGEVQPETGTREGLSIAARNDKSAAEISGVKEFSRIENTVTLSGTSADNRAVVRNAEIDVMANSTLRLNHVLLEASSRITDDAAVLLVDDVVAEVYMGTNALSTESLLSAGCTLTQMGTDTPVTLTVTETSRVLQISSTLLDTVTITGNDLIIQIRDLDSAAMSGYDFVSLTFTDGTNAAMLSTDLSITLVNISIEGETIETVYYAGASNGQTDTIYFQTKDMGSVPEPTTATLSLLALAALAARRRRK